MMGHFQANNAAEVLQHDRRLDPLALGSTKHDKVRGGVRARTTLAFALYCRGLEGRCIGNDGRQSSPEEFQDSRVEGIVLRLALVGQPECARLPCAIEEGTAKHQERRNG
jgi:hypothetical protein